MYLYTRLHKVEWQPYDKCRFAWSHVTAGILGMDNLTVCRLSVHENSSMPCFMKPGNNLAAWPQSLPLMPSYLCLGKLIFMMWEHQVPATSMDVNDRPHDMANHGAALYVPSGPARAPRAVPGRLPSLGCLPQSKVCWRALAVVHSHTLTSTVVVLCGWAVAHELYP